MTEELDELDEIKETKETKEIMEILLRADGSQPMVRNLAAGFGVGCDGRCLRLREFMGLREFMDGTRSSVQEESRGGDCS